MTPHRHPRSLPGKVLEPRTRGGGKHPTLLSLWGGATSLLGPLPAPRPRASPSLSPDATPHEGHRSRKHTVGSDGRRGRQPPWGLSLPWASSSADWHTGPQRRSGNPGGHWGGQGQDPETHSPLSSAPWTLPPAEVQPAGHLGASSCDLGRGLHLNEFRPDRTPGGQSAQTDGASDPPHPWNWG